MLTKKRPCFAALWGLCMPKYLQFFVYAMRTSIEHELLHQGVIINYCEGIKYVTFFKKSTVSGSF